MHSDTVIIIPARLDSTRLSKKVLLDINGLPMVIRVANQSRLAKIAPVILACGDQEIAEVAREYGYEAILTDPALPSGTDRVFAALRELKDEIKYIINVQGDIPYIKPSTIIETYKLLIKSEADISTAVSFIPESEISTADNHNVVKAVLAGDGRAVFFTRTRCPFGDGPLYKHIGIYCYTRDALEKFVHLPVSELEKREGLEQLRALEHRMKIYAAIVDDYPISIDTTEDLKCLRNNYL